MFGLPDEEYHLEFTRHIDGSPCPAPTKDNLLVFYMSEDSEMKKVSKGCMHWDTMKWNQKIHIGKIRG